MTALVDALTALALDRSLVQPLTRFAALFHKWNRSINLSAARTEGELHAHLIDSLHVVPHVRAVSQTASAPIRILDVGAGGGLPSVVVAICVPESHITALEPVHKKHAFLRTAARELSLPHFEPLAIRIDDHAPRDYDIAMSRATFDLVDWLTLALPRVHPTGLVLGFEAIPRTDLPAAAERHPYTIDGKSRSIISLRHP